MKHQKIFLSTEIIEEKTAKTKAKTDVMEILLKDGYHPVYFPKIRSIAELYDFWKRLGKIMADDAHLVIEYPISPRKRIWLLYLIKKLKNVPLYAIIHDIMDLRLPPASGATKDVHFLKLFDGIVSHNASMTRWLREKGYRKKVIDLKVFDYCLKSDNNYYEDNLKAPVKVLYAGNLAFNKATYVYDEQLGKLNQVELCLYGQYFEQEKIKSSKVLYKGMFNPDQPDLKEKYHFGLIWEGESIQTCSGQLGEYIRFNNPHKFSLYLALGLPVIVWKEAAIAAFVLEKRIGVAIDSLEELNRLGEQFPEEDYREYVENIRALASQVRHGFFMQKAVHQLTNN